MALKSLMSKGIYPLFKLILGLGNKDKEAAKEVSLIYSKLGIDLIDSSLEVYSELKDYLAKNGIDLNKTKLGISVALSGDIHAKKVKINKNCKLCGACALVCSAKAIEKIEDGKGEYRVNSKKCVGCSHCKKACKYNAIDSYEINSFKDDIDFIKENNLKPAFLELHLSVKKKKEIIQSFKYVLENYKGNISICLSRRYFGSDKIKKTIAKLKKMFEQSCFGCEFTIQADGTSVNNANGEYSSNLEALAFYKELSDLGLNVIMAGGLNQKTVELCKMFNLKPCGLAFGSYARKIIDDSAKVQKLVYDVSEFYKC